MRRRMHLIPFETKPLVKDMDLPDKLKEEISCDPSMDYRRREGMDGAGVEPTTGRNPSNR